MIRRLLHYVFIAVLFIVGTSAASFAQDEDRVQWSATKRLTLADFRMVVPMAPSQYSYISLVTKYFVHGYDAFGGNLNKKVTNYMIPSAPSGRSVRFVPTLRSVTLPKQICAYLLLPISTSHSTFVPS